MGTVRANAGRTAWRRHMPEIGLALAVVTVIALLIAPIPAPALDVLLALNLTLAVVVVLVALSVRRPLSVSAFPAILLVATLFRLGLNVSSTRLILGEAWAGEVIAAFASWVVAGSLVVGVVIFLILTVIQFVVIARGGERVAEVAARFALDAMPGRQMAIDADVRAGAMSLSDASRVRDRLQRESRLYGAMDGAMKFVRGDAIAGIFILGVDLVGGIVVGTLEHGMSLGEALQTYGRLTIGDGLVTQIPALLIAMGAALVVTRVASTSEHVEPTQLGSDIAEQIGAHPRALGIAALFAAVAALLPGLPAAPFLLLAAVLLTCATWLALRPGDGDATELGASRAHGALPPRLALRRPTRSGADVPGDDTVAALVAEVADDLGVPLPSPVVIDDDSENAVVIELDGYAGGPPLPCPVSDDTLAEAIRKLVPSLLSMEDVQHMLDDWERREPALVRAVVPTHLSLFELTQVLRDLLDDGVAVRPLRAVLEALLALEPDATHGARVRAARRALAVQIGLRVAHRNTPVVVVGPRCTRMLRDAVRDGDDGGLRMAADLQDELANVVLDGVEEARTSDGAAAGDAPAPVVVAVDDDLRQSLETVVEHRAPELQLVGLDELRAIEARGVALPEPVVADIGQ